MSDQDIVITGVGAVTSNGLNYEEFVENCLSGKTGIRKCQRIDISSLKGQFVGEIDYSELEKRVGNTDIYDKTTYRHIVRQKKQPNSLD